MFEISCLNYHIWTIMFELSCLNYHVWTIMFELSCLKYQMFELSCLNYLMFELSCLKYLMFEISWLNYHVWTIMFELSCLNYHVYHVYYVCVINLMLLCTIKKIQSIFNIFFKFSFLLNYLLQIQQKYFFFNFSCHNFFLLHPPFCSFVNSPSWHFELKVFFLKSMILIIALQGVLERASRGTETDGTISNRNQPITAIFYLYRESWYICLLTLIFK